MLIQDQTSIPIAYFESVRTSIMNRLIIEPSLILVLLILVSYFGTHFLTKCPFVRNEIGNASKHVHANFAFIDHVHFVKKDLLHLRCACFQGYIFQISSKK